VAQFAQSGRRRQAGAHVRLAGAYAGHGAGLQAKAVSCAGLPWVEAAVTAVEENYTLAFTSV